MNVFDRYKKILIYITVTLLATNCGGGGGGGGGSASVRSNNPSNVSADLAEKSHELEEDVVISENVSIVNYVKANDEIDRRVKVGIIDGDFLTRKEEIEAIYPNIIILDNIPANRVLTGSDHGERILKYLGAKDVVDAVAGTVGKKSGGKDLIRPNIPTYEKVFENLKSEKIKIVNQSWGIPFNKSLEDIKDYEGLVIASGLYGEKAKKIGRQAIEFFKQKINEENAIFIWANGNYLKKKKVGVPAIELDHGSVQAQLPLKVPELEKGWITTVGVEPARATILPNGELGYIKGIHYKEHLAYPAEAKNWAISASGDGGFPKFGSSFAVPRVTRAAALVARKYEWMTNDQVRQVLFSTTDKPELKYHKNGRLYGDVDPRYLEKEADPKYGWGILNTQRALGGPGAFNEGDFIVELPKERISEFLNDIYGEGGLHKRGEGRLMLKGENRFTGATEIERGILDIYRGHLSDVIVGKEGVLALHKKSKLEGNLVNEGRVALVGKDNNAVVNGDFISTENSVIEYEKGAKLVVKGSSKLLNPTLSVKDSGYVTKKGEEQKVIEGSKIEGKIEKIKSSGNKVVTIVEDKKDLVVTVARRTLLDYFKEHELLDKLESAMINTANNIEKELEKLDEKVEEGDITAEELALGESILELSAPALLDATYKMSGEIYASAQALTFEQARNINRNLSNHFGSLREFKNSGYEWQGWVDGIVTSGNIEQSGFAKAKTKVNGTQFGLDKKIDPNTQVGVALDYSYAKADFNKYAGRFNSDGVGAALYAKRYLAGDFYLLGKVGVHRYSTRVQREILDANLSSQMGDIKHHDRMLSSYIEIGKEFRGLTPFVAYSYDNLKRGGFSENASWGIVADAKKYNNKSVQLGLRKEFSRENTRAQLHILHSINVGRRNLDFEGRFVGSDLRHEFTGVRQSKNTTWVGFGISQRITPQFDINGKYDMKIEKRKNMDSIFSVGFKYRF